MKKIRIVIFMLILLNVKIFAHSTNSLYSIYFAFGTAFEAYVGYSSYHKQNKTWKDVFFPKKHRVFDEVDIPGFIGPYDVYTCIDVIRFVYGRRGYTFLTIGRYVFTIIDDNKPKTKITTWGTTLNPQFYLENIKLVRHEIFDTEIRKRYRPCRP